MQSYIFPYSHARSLRWGQKVNPFYSECGHVAYQIKCKEV